MKLVKSLLLSGAAGLVAMSGASAADLAVTKPAPAEYVRVCSAEGAGFFYIPGTETCLKIGGWVQLDVDFNNTTSFFQNAGPDAIVGTADDQYSPNRKAFDLQPGARLEFDSRTATSLGTLRGFIGLEFYGNGNTIRVKNGTASAAGDVLAIDRAFISLAGFTAGRADTFYGFDDPIFAQGGGADLVGYQFVAGNGFYAGASFEHPTGVGFVDPAINIGSGVLQVGYLNGGTHVRLAGKVGKFNNATSYGIQLQAQQKFGTGTTIFGAAEYNDNSVAGNPYQVNLTLQLSQKFNDSFSGVVGVGYRHNEGVVADQWAVKGGFDYTVVPGFTVGPEVTYTHTERAAKQTFDGRLRFRRSF